MGAEVEHCEDKDTRQRAEVEWYEVRGQSNLIYMSVLLSPEVVSSAYELGLVWTFHTSKKSLFPR